MKPAEAVNKEN